MTPETKNTQRPAFLSDLHHMTIAEAGALIKARRLSPVELTEAYLRRINALDGQISAFITLTADLAMEQARRAEQEIAAGQYRGPMHGIPFGLKDLYDTSGILTTGHSKVRSHHVPKIDATVTKKLYRGGGVLLGKLATSEFAHGAPSLDAPWPPARNPWNTRHFTGSSSSGSAAAVTAGFLPAALGTDTGGSVRVPAGMCGTVGLKPTYGLVSRYGVTPNSFTFDHCGPLTWTVEDAAIILDVIAGYDPLDPGSVDKPSPNYRDSLRCDIKGMRIGVLRHFWEEDLRTNEELVAAMNEALHVFRHLGAQVVEDVRVRRLQNYVDVKMVIAETEIFSVHHKDLISRCHEFGLNFLAQTLTGCLFQSVDYVAAQRERGRMLREMRQLYEKYDVLVTASSTPAPALDEYSPLAMWIRPNIYVPFSIMAGPAIAICNGYSKAGLPLSMQLAGRPFDEISLLSAAHAYERATPWRSRRPRLVPGTSEAAVFPAYRPSSSPIDNDVRGVVEKLARRAGLDMGEQQLRLLCEVAPYAFAMAERIPHDHEWGEGPCDVFHPAIS